MWDEFENLPVSANSSVCVIRADFKILKDDCHLLVRGRDEKICTVCVAGIVGWVPRRVEFPLLFADTLIREAAAAVRCWRARYPVFYKKGKKMERKLD